MSWALLTGTQPYKNTKYAVPLGGGTTNYVANPLAL